jgi:hypothetical protein
MLNNFKVSYGIDTRQKKVMDRRHKLKTKVEIVFESPICQTFKALTLTLEMAWQTERQFMRHAN